MLLLFGGEYFGFMMRKGAMDWTGEASMLTAVLSTSLFIITGIASLPSVGQAMNKAQFMIVFGPVVWLALSFGLAHVMLSSKLDRNSTEPLHMDKRYATRNFDVVDLSTPSSLHQGRSGLHVVVCGNSE